MDARRTGSEVMGLMASGCQLTPTADSLKTQAAGPSSSQPFVIFAMCPHFSTASPKCQSLLFHEMKENFNKISLCSIQKFWYTKQLTNLFVCGLMSTVYITKTLTEICPCSDACREPAVGASRSGVHGQSGSRVGPVNELRLQ